VSLRAAPTLHRVGALAGLVAGLVAGTAALFVAEPTIERAIAAEERQAQAGAAAQADHAVVVSREAQRLGLVVATGIYGFAVGGFVALAYGRAGRRRSGFKRPAQAALGFAALAFVAVSLIPSLKYPPAPPGVGDPDTVGTRTFLYLVAVAISLAAVVAAVRAGRAAPRRWARPATALCFLVVVGLAYGVLPSAETAIGEPGQAEFQLVAITTQALLWAVFGLVFAAAVRRSGAAA